MELNAWSILLIAFLSQTLFLIFFLAFRPAINWNAKTILVVLLIITFFIQFSNFCEATYLYRRFYGITEWSRGMGLLLGPALYLYTLSILNPNFNFKGSHMLHTIPYAMAIGIVYLQNHSVNDRIIVLTIDAVMAGTMKMTAVSDLWFVAYFLHMTTYLLVIKHIMIKAKQNTENRLKVPTGHRIEWLKKIVLLFTMLVLMYLGIIIYVILTGYYSAGGNFVYSMLLGGMVYTIAFHAVSDSKTLEPDFEKKYNTINLDQRSEDEISIKIIYFFEREKVFLDPDFRIGTLAKKMQVASHIISRVINHKLNKSFSELVAFYRVEEVKKRLRQRKYRNLTIIGIAMDVGFTSKSAFNEAFKKQLGVTPSLYLKTLDPNIPILILTLSVLLGRM